MPYYKWIFNFTHTWWNFNRLARIKWNMALKYLGEDRGFHWDWRRTILFNSSGEKKKNSKLTSIKVFTCNRVIYLWIFFSPLKIGGILYRMIELETFFPIILKCWNNWVIETRLFYTEPSKHTVLFCSVQVKQLERNSTLVQAKE